MESDKLLNELVALEWNQESDKVDHPPRGSKDIADAVCGAVWLAAMSRELRNGGAFMDEVANLTEHTDNAPEDGCVPRVGKGARSCLQVCIKNI